MLHFKLSLGIIYAIPRIMHKIVMSYYMVIIINNS